MIHDAHARRQRHRLLLIVRDHDESDAETLLDVEQLELRALAQLAVERGQRLIEEQQLGTLGERARQRDPLALAAGELVRLAARVRRSSARSPGSRATRRLISGRPSRSCSRPKATFFSTVMWGKSAYDWNIMLTGRS